MNDEILYHERLSSNRTEALFLALMMLFLLLAVLRMTSAGLDILASVFNFFFLVFLFYSLNFRTLVIHLTAVSMKLTFGIFTWKVAMDNIEACALDDVPLVMRNGGAGIHFMFIRKRYRASFNFLEYPRLVIALKRKAGLVWDISFSTRQPGEVQQLIRSAISA